MLAKSLLLLAGALLTAASPTPQSSDASVSTQSVPGQSKCKCTPTDSCWPKDISWNLFNLTLGGQLIATTPVAVSCYPGPLQNAAQCANVVANSSSMRFQELFPLGLAFDAEVTCPPVNVSAGQKPGTCTIGDNPVYAVNATNDFHVSAAVLFAELFNIRLVIKSTGHDLMGRSNGYGSLEVWLHNYKNGINFQKTFQSATSCKSSGWTGPAIQINGAYTWESVYAVAKSNNVVVVGGGTPTVCSTGGWMQGGGHGPASRDYGLGADQVLEARVLLWTGEVVTVNACQNSDVFFAIRGGGPSAYGIVLSTTVKAHPNSAMVVQHLAIGPLTNDFSSLLDAITVLWQAMPDLNDAGYSGYGEWTIASAAPLFANFTAGYVHGIWMFGKTQAQAQAAFATTRAKLAAYNTTLFISESYVSYNDYWSFYAAESGVEPPVGGGGSAFGSRLFGRSDLQNTAAVRSMIGTLAGTPDQFTINSIEIVSGGQVFKDASDPFSGLTPAWRTSYFNNIVGRGWLLGTDAATVKSIQDDITFTKIGAMKKVAPETGSYMNEGDRLDPDFKVDFYGSHYSKLLSIKTARDPLGVFYCPTCVGSDLWAEDSIGRLCKTS